jgi:hypothetical protein
LRTTGLQTIENKISEIIISPNPSSYSVRFELSEKATVTLYNTLGQQIGVCSFEAGTAEIDLHKLNISQGIYSLEIKNERGTQVQKLVYDPE